MLNLVPASNDRQSQGFQCLAKLSAAAIAAAPFAASPRLTAVIGWRWTAPLAGLSPLKYGRDASRQAFLLRAPRIRRATPSFASS